MVVAEPVGELCWFGSILELFEMAMLVEWGVGSL